MGSIAATGTPARLKLIVEGSGPKLYIWSYRIRLKNELPSEVMLIARRWWIDEGKGFQPVPKEGMAPSIAGAHPSVGAGKEFSYEAGVTTRSKNPVAMKGEFVGFDFRRNALITVPVGTFGFENEGEAPSFRSDEKLSIADASKLQEYCHVYQRSVRTEEAAIFRVEDIGLSAKGAAALNAFLLASEYREPAKSREFDFSPIVPDRYKVKIVDCDDHYFLPVKKAARESKTAIYFSFVISCRMLNMPPRGPSKGAALKMEVSKLVASFGFRDVLLEIAGRAPTHDSAPNEGMVTVKSVADQRDAFDVLLEEKKVPGLSRDLTKLELQAAILKSTAVKWVERKAKGGEFASMNAPTFLRTVLSPLVADDGTVYMDLIKSVDRGLATALESYSSSRRSQSKDMGDAEGLRFVVRPTGRKTLSRKSPRP